jgi:hypothetical protein
MNWSTRPAFDILANPRSGRDATKKFAEYGTVPFETDDRVSESLVCGSIQT